MPCLRHELISSEDSETETDEEGGKCFQFTVRPLPWRSDKVSSFFSQLDAKSAKYQSKKSSLMTHKRVHGLPSDRPKPDVLPEWCVKSEI